MADRQRDIETAKHERRDEVRAKMAVMSADRRHEASVQAVSRLVGLEAFRHAQVVMLYMPLATELDVTGAALHCFRTGKTVCVPSVNWDTHEMAPVEVLSFDDEVMDVDDRGIRTPRDGRTVSANLVDLVIVPGLAFDLAGGRLGRGGGFYDQFLARLRPETTIIGIAYDEQIIDEVPLANHDRRMDIVVTDRRQSFADSPRPAR